MNGNSVLIDTNIALYLLSGDRDLADLLWLKRIHISFINELELLGYAELTLAQQQKITSSLKDCQISDINPEIKNETVKLRTRYKLRLPDCIALATERYLKIPFLTADLDFKRVDDKDVIILNNKA
jgi:predicted nucleic acid-binding protein